MDLTATTPDLAKLRAPELKLDLPADFRDLVNRSLSLQARVRRVDEEIYGANASAPVEPRRKSNPVSDQITLLKTAFGRG